MVERFTPRAKEGRIVIRVDAEFESAVDELATRRFEGNRSLLVRTALRDLLRQHEQDTTTKKVQVA